MKINVGGVTISYEEAGTGTPVVLLHGSGPGVSAKANWGRTITAVADMGYRAIAPDFLGFGESDRPEGYTYTSSKWAESVAAFLTALDLGPVHLVGNSMGGRIALTLAARSPELVRSLTLMGVLSPSVPRSEALTNLRGFAPSYDSMRTTLRDVFVVNPDIVSDELVQARFEAASRPGEAEHYRAMFSTPEANLLPLTEDQLREIAAPALVLHGREDKVVPVENGISLGMLLPEVTSVLVSSCGHWVQVEQADLFEAQLKLFLAGVDAS
ncbi:alpha/beta fold hydrolase [Nocardioides sp. Kera G14]|uniref:alpha/beta fold hydrolase n=1 Tax=Nocardioides sp. Kera G14 TaxID=2884264 RepID=UPI001D10EEB7|nr:alpha/beta hydrolase [Nocardioides sp. Kera G14]UDY24594.1 alpha/beta fold hydrolase [Nocardioides sp. Kera G14]